MKPPIGANRIANKAPFTDEQLADIIKACGHINGYKKDGRWGNRFGSGNWTGDDLKDFIWFMTHTGLRISDVVLFDIERLHGNEVFLRAKKNGGEVFVWIPDWLRDRLQARVKQFGKQPFMVSGSQRLDGDDRHLAGEACKGIRTRRHRCRTWLRRTDFGTRSRVSCCSAACRLRTSLISWVMMRRRSGNIIRRWVLERQATAIKDFEGRLWRQTEAGRIKGASTWLTPHTQVERAAS